MTEKVVKASPVPHDSPSLGVKRHSTFMTSQQGEHIRCAVKIQATDPIRIKVKGRVPLASRTGYIWV